MIVIYFFSFDHLQLLLLYLTDSTIIDGKSDTNVIFFSIWK